MLALAAVVLASIVAGTAGAVAPRLGWRWVWALIVVALTLTGAFGHVVAHYWRSHDVDGPGQGMYFLFLLLPAALLLSTVGGLTSAWIRRGQGATPARAARDATGVVALTLATLFALQL